MSPCRQLARCRDLPYQAISFNIINYFNKNAIVLKIEFTSFIIRFGITNQLRVWFLDIFCHKKAHSYKWAKRKIINFRNYFDFAFLETLETSKASRLDLYYQRLKSSFLK